MEHKRKAGNTQRVRNSQSIEQRMYKRNIVSYNALRGLCAVGIFCHHNSYLADALNPFWQGIYNCFLKYGSRCTSFFFIMSGFLLAYTWKDRNFGDYIKRKLKRLYPLTLFVFVLAIGCSFVLNDAVNGSMAVGSNMWWASIILNLTLLKAFVPIEDVFYSFHGPSWYISVLFVFYIVGYFSVKKLKAEQVVKAGTYKSVNDRLAPILRIGGGICLIYLVQFVLCVVVDTKGLSGMRLYLTYVNPYFRIFGEGMLGVFLCETMPWIQERIKCWNKSVLEVSSLILFVAFFLLNYFIRSSVWSAWVWFIPVTFLIVSFNDDSGILSRCFCGRDWQFLGNISFELYMTHAFVYEGLPVIVGLVSGSLRSWLVYHAGTRFVITFVLSVVFSWVIHVVLEWVMKKIKI